MAEKQQKNMALDELTKAHDELDAIMHPQREKDETVEKSLSLAEKLAKIASSLISLSKGGKSTGHEEPDGDECAEEQETEEQEKSVKKVSAAESLKKGMADSPELEGVMDASQAMYDFGGVVVKSVALLDSNDKNLLGRVVVIEDMQRMICKSLALLLETNAEMKKSLDARPKSDPMSGIFPFFNGGKPNAEMEKGRNYEVSTGSYDDVEINLTKAVNDGVLAPQALADFSSDPSEVLKSIAPNIREKYGLPETLAN